jgi:glycosyltransferase involved in cell wall biosynthesis
VAFLSERADFYGGGQRSLFDLATHLKAARGGGFCDPLVVVPERGPLSDALEARGVACEFLKLPSWRATPLACLRAWTRLVALARRRRLNLMHSDAPRAALYAGAAARLTGRRHVLHLRSSRPVSPPFERLLLALCDRAIAVSRATAGRSNAMKTSSRVRVVPTGLPPIEHLGRDAARDRLGLPRHGFLAGVVGRIEPDKGGEDAVAALPAIRRVRDDARLVFLGASPPGDRHVETLRSLAAAVGVAEAVLFAGDRPEAASLLAAFDLVLHPSRHEALPRVLIEALFAGVPVVASAVGGIPEVIESGRCGLLVPPRDPEALAAAAATLAGDPELRRRFGEQGRARARELFSIEAMVFRIVAIYEEILPPDPAAASGWSADVALRSEENSR